MEMEKVYQPSIIEKKWIEYWDNKSAFTPILPNTKPAYSIVIPPPNVTGVLHMGHALNLTLQDILCRFKRQQGFQVLWVPGTDHAGIATQNVVERSLTAEKKSRESLGREKFIEKVWEWKKEYGDKILGQIKRIGASVDWSRTRFTMDEGLSKAVREVFVTLYEEGLIYQSNYIINWCPRCHTALSDIEVEHDEIEGTLYHIFYPFEDESGGLIIATTRPETMFADVAVAVHPEDERYNKFIGKKIKLPLTARTITIIADTYVTREFGTGCLKVTPAHDINDFEIGRRHNLETIIAFDEDGIMNDSSGEFEGLERFEARKVVVEALRQNGNLQKEEVYLTSLGKCYRCSTVVEPYISKQWFVSTKSLAKQAIDAVRDGKTKIFPSHWDKTYFDWMDNIRDWCISRQIWWGHRIPAWHCQDCEELIVSKIDITKCSKCGSFNVVQDEDVLDTWFSSALWPFSTMGWPDKTAELSTFYPTSCLVTGFDILFFWVARMMMMGIHFMDEIPFHEVYIHALVRDKNGQKMSKSKGNVIDPIAIIDIYGSDAFRFTLTALAAMGRDVRMSEERIEGYSHFINKIWNIAKFAMMHIDEATLEFDETKIEGLHHQWILHRLEQVKQETIKFIDEYRFNDYANSLYQFVWREVCDWYLELIKSDLYSEDLSKKQRTAANLKQVLKEILLLLHPSIPFVTQEIWNTLPKQIYEDITTVSFPEPRPSCNNLRAQKDMELVQEMVVAIRNMRSELNIVPSNKLDIFIRGGDEIKSFIIKYEWMLVGQARLGKITMVDEKYISPKFCATSVVKRAEIIIPLVDNIDLDAETERLDKEYARVKKDYDFIFNKLNKESFVKKAPVEIVEKERQKLIALEDTLSKLNVLKDKLGKIQEN